MRPVDDARGAGRADRALSLEGIAQQILASRMMVLGIFVVLVALGLSLAYVYYGTSINPHHLVADPHEIGFLPEYTGMYSYAGVLVLWTAGVVSVLTGLVARGDELLSRNVAFHLTFGALLGLLAADDLFMLHEWGGLILAEASGAEDVGFARSRLEGVVFAGIGLVWIAWLLRFRRTILRTPYVLLAVGLLGFGASVGLDMIFYILPDLEPVSMLRRLFLSLLEEMLKLTGIFFMLAYAWRIGADVFQQRVGQGGEGWPA